MASQRPASTYRRATGVFGVTVVGLGLAMIAVAVGGGGGPFSLGVVMGTMFLALGVLRLYLLRKAQ